MPQQALSPQSGGCRPPPAPTRRGLRLLKPDILETLGVGVARGLSPTNVIDPAGRTPGTGGGLWKGGLRGCPGDTEGPGVSPLRQQRPSSWSRPGVPLLPMLPPAAKRAGRGEPVPHKPTGRPPWPPAAQSPAPAGGAARGRCAPQPSGAARKGRGGPAAPRSARRPLCLHGRRSAFPEF